MLDPKSFFIGKFFPFDPATQLTGRQGFKSVKHLPHKNYQTFLIFWNITDDWVSVQDHMFNMSIHASGNPSSCNRKEFSSTLELLHSNSLYDTRDTEKNQL